MRFDFIHFVMPQYNCPHLIELTQAFDFTDQLPLPVYHHGLWILNELLHLGQKVIWRGR